MILYLKRKRCHLVQQAESTLFAFQPRKAMPSYLLSTIIVCTLDAVDDHHRKPVEQPLDPQSTMMSVCFQWHVW
eukprot:777387-Pelagomonas_calceolata.AAC.2